MASHSEHSEIETHATVRTLLELRQSEDGTWVATQPDVDHDGTGETGALAVMDYCRQVAKAGETDNSDCR